MKNKLIKLLGGFTGEEVEKMIFSALCKYKLIKMLKKNNGTDKLPDYNTTFDGWRER